MGVDGAAEVSWARAEGKVSPQKRDCVATAADAASLWLRARKARHSERIREEEIAMGSTPADQLAQALDTTERLINGIGDDQWTNATPCTDWTVRDLVNHVVFGNWLFAGLLAGNQPPPLDEMLRQQSTDRLAADRTGARHRRAAPTHRRGAGARLGYRRGDRAVRRLSGRPRRTRAGLLPGQDGGHTAWSTPVRSAAADR